MESTNSDNPLPAPSSTASSPHSTPGGELHASMSNSKEFLVVEEDDHTEHRITAQPAAAPPATASTGSSSPLASVVPSLPDYDGTFDMPPEALEAVEKALAPGELAGSLTDNSNNNHQSNINSTGPTTGKGAQILMNRFSTWRQKANENAQVLLERAKEAREQGTLPAAVAPMSNMVFGKKQNSNDENDDDRSISSDSSSSSNGSHDEDQPRHSRTLPINYNLPTRKEMRSKVQNLAQDALARVEATGVGQTLLQEGGFRGRYSEDPNGNTNQISVVDPPSPTAEEKQRAAEHSQTALILKSRAAAHLQEMLDSLERYQYVLLLGSGRLEVNLKDAYHVKQGMGTYVDFLVRGGAADRSGVVGVGDSVVKVGSIDVRKQTIDTVPNVIAQAKRPVVLVLATGVPVDVERITAVDVAVAMMHRIRYLHEREAKQQYLAAKVITPPTSPLATPTKDGKPAGTLGSSAEDGQPTSPKTESPAVAAADTNNVELSGTPQDDNRTDETKEEEEKKDSDSLDESGDHEADAAAAAEKDYGDDAAFENVVIPVVRSVEGYVNPPSPPLQARQAYQHLVGKRCNDNFSISQLKQAMDTDENFRAILRNAFLCCAVDGRRFPFLGRHFSLEQDLEKQQQEQQQQQQQQQAVGLFRRSAISKNQPVNSNIHANHQQEANKNAPNALLMLFLELTSFSDLHGVTPPSRRRDIAKRIAYKFFLPTRLPAGAAGGERLEPPMFDFHHIVSDVALRDLETTLNNEETEISRDLFVEFQHAVVEALSGTPFLLFLVSNQAARMRGYLRNVAPFVNVNLEHVFRELVGIKRGGENANQALVPLIHPGAKNYFLYMLMHLIQLEKDPTASLSTDASTFVGTNGRRMVGAPGGLCCYVYIFRVVVPALQKFLKLIESSIGSAAANASADEKPEGEIKADEAAENEVMGSVSNATATVEIDHSDCVTVVRAIDQLWEIFVAPGVGALELAWKSKETKEILESLRNHLKMIRNEVFGGISTKDEEAARKCETLFAKRFSSDMKLLQQLQTLAEQLLYDYAINLHPKFREHRYHEWMCNEMAKTHKETTPTEAKTERHLPDLPSGCIKRLLRKIDLPAGVSPHKPLHSNKSSMDSSTTSTVDAKGYPNADCAVVFGSGVGHELAAHMMSPAMDHSDIRRYACQDVTPDGDKVPGAFHEAMIPPTLESYAVLPPSRTSGFSSITGNVCLSSDGWNVTMVNFMIPKANTDADAEEESSLYGVSLVFQRSSTARFHPRRISQTQLVKESEPQGAPAEGTPTIDDAGKFASPISFGTPSDDHWSTFTRSIKVSDDLPTFNSHMRGKAWVDRVLQDDLRDQEMPAAVGVALVSRRNVVIAMRQTLRMLLQDFSRMPDDDSSTDQGGSDVITCGALVDILGNFAHQDVEAASLRCLLGPYIHSSSSSWIERPLREQREEFERLAGQQLITCLPPIPLALLFVLTLLEQKIVLSSSRRSILFSATQALTGLLKPLKWCHLLVPLVPSALAKDLLQYPAPFILGMPSEDPGIMELMNELPMDVTLVDLDVGRVILAPEFSLDTESSGRSEESAAEKMRALRSQVLYLAQVLGSVFGAKLFRDAWSCDNPSLALSSTDGSRVKQPVVGPGYDVLRSVCQNFITELLAGAPSSCYWIEESLPESKPESKSGSPESTVIFDEDKFYHIKGWREENGYEPLVQHAGRTINRNLALSNSGFNFVLETFVRCQSMNWYLSSQPKDKMTFFL